LAPILNRDRAIIAESVRTLIQETLDSYDSGRASCVSTSTAPTRPNR
jgi:hypothetical protein